MHLSPDPDFEEFVLDCIRLSKQEKSPILRRKLLTIAREWMHAAMHQQSAEIHRGGTEPMNANSGEPWSQADISDRGDITLQSSPSSRQSRTGRRSSPTSRRLCRPGRSC
jgi:hypothetical protein